MKSFLIDTRGLRDPGDEAIDPKGRLRVMPAAFWAMTTPEERGAFGVQNGLYSFPTVELVHRLTEIIDGRNAIEVGAGHGVLAEALGIVATDSYQQIEPQYRAVYEAMQQPIVPYGSNVEKLDAKAAIRKHKPQVVIGCWVTHRYDPRRHAAGGNEAGLDEEWILDHCETYVVVGNAKVHEGKAIWSRPHTIEHPAYVVSRALNGSPDFIAVWKGAQ